ncbi:hypothetical protein [Roseinatronobacter alkalisoli]|uniref:Capsular biosynthesis protein n=1 Tax=Roseinatronobacter alkalisoli TaxID=3028235 RepID=A0ABT5T483_9RHOB|nr:hypothetical protein [Roseinatronobacter sp. HJB301]MDD7969923.1 hypothetical protein [Roseinatronobacter sp. HJB301]
MPGIVLHLKERDLAADLQGWHMRLYNLIRQIAQRNDVLVHLRRRDPDIHVGTRSIDDNRFADGCLHILDDRSVRAGNVLNAGVAYFWEFWHLDPAGVKAFSSAGETAYIPSPAADDTTRCIATRLRARYVAQRKSRYDQHAPATCLPEGVVAVFFQGQYPRASGATPFTDFDMLIAALRNANGRPVVVKPHPLSSSRIDNLRLQALQLALGRKRLIVTQAHVHDILDAAVVTVSMNSTVALEGFLKSVPAILLGKTDFHHLAGKVEDMRDFGSILRQELDRSADYDRYLNWYFETHCLDLEAPNLESQIWARFAAAGFPQERLKSG